MTRRATVLLLLVPFATACARSHPVPENSAAPSAAPEAPAPAPLVSSQAPSAPSSTMPGSTQPVEVTTDPKLAVKQLAQATKELDDVLSAGAPDCGAAKALRDRICALARRICELAERDHDPEIAQRCAEAKPSCDRAVTRVAGPCG